MKLTVKDIKELWNNGQAELVAGAEGLDRPVAFYDMMEQPDIKPWLRKELLLITTGYAIRKDKEAVLTLIRDLNEAGASALAIKTRFFDRFPQEALELLRSYFEDLADQREKVQDEAAAALEAAFDFMEDAFGESQEMVVFVTELTVSPAAHTFIAENGCQRYFRYNKELLLDNRKAALDRELAAEEQRHGAGPKG